MAANLDLNGKLIKRGLLVSWHGLRGEVQRVRTGRALVRLPNGGNTGGVRVPGERSDRWLSCSTVQVVT